MRRILFFPSAPLSSHSICPPWRQCPSRSCAFPRPPRIRLSTVARSRQWSKPSQWPRARRRGGSDVGKSSGLADANVTDRAHTNIGVGIVGPMPANEVCGVVGCGKEAKRSLSTTKVKEALPELKLIGEPRRVHLCKDHYKQFRKKTKQERELERATWQ